MGFDQLWLRVCLDLREQTTSTLFSVIVSQRKNPTDSNIFTINFVEPASVLLIE